jgi:membrane protein DedA with SNARE-associated domain
MFSSLVHFAQNSLVPLGSMGVFLGSFIGEVVGPFPSVGMILGASFWLVNHLSFSFTLVFKILFLISLPEALGVTLGSFVIYSIVYFGGKPAIEKIGKYFGLSWEAVEKYHNHLQKTKREGLYIFIVRAVPLIPNILINATCGLLRVNTFRYAVATFLGSFVRGSIYAMLGWYLGSTYKIYSKFFVQYERRIFIVSIIAVIVFLVWFLIKKSKSKKHLV